MASYVKIITRFLRHVNVLSARKSFVTICGIVAFALAKNAQADVNNYNYCVNILCFPGCILISVFSELKKRNFHAIELEAEVHS